MLGLGAAAGAAGAMSEPESQKPSAAGKPRRVETVSAWRECHKSQGLCEGVNRPPRRRRRPMPPAFACHHPAGMTAIGKTRLCPCPGGTNENSPAFQRWERCRRARVPKGRLNARGLSRPFGTHPAGRGPNVETLGYSQQSLRDKYLPDPILEQLPDPPARASTTALRGLPDFFTALPEQDLDQIVKPVLRILHAAQDRTRFCPCPGGTPENSPAFQRWDRSPSVPSPEGTAEAAVLNRPVGTYRASRAHWTRFFGKS